MPELVEPVAAAVGQRQPEGPFPMEPSPLVIAEALALRSAQMEHETNPQRQNIRQQ
jgi:hypothetical protein